MLVLFIHKSVSLSFTMCGKFLVIIFFYSMISIFWRMSFICHLFSLFLPSSLIFFLILGSPLTCFVILNFVYLLISPLEVEFQRNLCCLFSLFLDTFPWREGKCWLDAAIFKLEVIQHVLQLFVLKSLKFKIYKTITIEYLYDFYLDPPVFNLLPHLLSLHFFC